MLLKRNPGEVADCYLGLLFPAAEYQVYGYITNTRIKFLLVLRDPSPRDDLLALLFKQLHATYVDHVSNPFGSPGMIARSANFDAAVNTAITSYNASARAL